MVRRSRQQRGAHGAAPRQSRKTLQLCGQVRRTLDYVLSGELNDDVLRNVAVVSVEPAPDASQLLVTVAPLVREDSPPADLIMQKLGIVQGVLRSEIAASITRRKVPNLLFQVAGPDAWEQDSPIDEHDRPREEE